MQYHGISHTTHILTHDSCYEKKNSDKILPCGAGALQIAKVTFSPLKTVRGKAAHFTTIYLEIRFKKNVKRVVHLSRGRFLFFFNAPRKSVLRKKSQAVPQAHATASTVGSTEGTRVGGSSAA